jgi:two-component system response regulator TctD
VTITAPLDSCLTLMKTGRPGAMLPYGPPEQIGRAFLIGAADYLCVPFTVSELEARIRRLEFRSESTWSYGSTIQIAGCDLVITSSRRDLLSLLYRHRGRIVDRDTVADSCGIARDDTSRSRAVDMAVSRLRREIAPAPVRIETIRGVGYRLVET